MGNKVETRGVYLYTDTTSAQKSYDALSIRQKKLQSELFELKKRQREYVDGVRNGNKEAIKNYQNLQAEIEKVRNKYTTVGNQMSNLSKKINGEVSLSFRELRAEVNRLKNEMDQLPINSPEWEKAKNNYDQAASKLRNYGITLGTIKTKLKETAKEVGTIALGSFIGMGVQSLLANAQNYFTGILDAALKTSDELTNIEKTTDLNADQVIEFNKELSKIDARTPTSDLRKLAEEGGKLGKGDSINGLASFVKKANEINLALGDDLGADAVITLSKASKQYGEELIKIASGVNSVGQASEATEKYQIDFLARLGGLSNILDIASGDIMGIGAVTEMSGQQVEMAGTAIQKVFLDLAKDTENFGKVAGMANGELTKIAQEKGYNEALLVFIERLKNASTSQADFLKRMEAVGINGERGASVFLALASKISLVREQQKLANDEVQKGTSVSIEAEKRNTNLAAQYEKFQKRLNAFKNSGVLKELFIYAIKSANGFLNQLEKLPVWIERNKVLMLSLASAILIYNGNMIKNTLLIIQNTAANIASNIAYEIGLSIVAAATVVENAYAAAKVRTGVATKTATFLQYLWNAALVANPIGIITAGVLALGGAIYLLGTRVKDQIKVEHEKEAMSYRLAKANAVVEASMKKINEQVNTFNNLSIKQREAVRNNIKDTAEKIKMDIASIEMDQKKIAMAARHLSLFEEANIESAVQKKLGQKYNMDSFIAMSKYFDEYKKMLNEAKEAAKDEKGKKATEENNKELDKLKQSLAEIKNAYIEVRPAMEIYADAMKIQTLTTEDYENKLNLLRDAQKRAIINSKEYSIITAEINKVQKEAIKLSSEKGSFISESEAKSISNNADELKRFRKELNDTLDKLKMAKADPYTKLFSEIGNDIDELTATAKEFTKEYPQLQAIIKQIEILRKNAGKSDLDKKQLAADYEEALNFGENYYQELRLNAKRSYANGLIDEKQYQNLLSNLELQGIDYKVKTAVNYEQVLVEKASADKLQWQQEYEDKSLDQAINYAKQKAALESGSSASTSAPGKKRFNELNFDEKSGVINKYASEINQYTQFINTIIGLAADYSRAVSDNENRELQRYKDTLDAKATLYKNQLDNKEISQTEYDARMQAMQSDYDKRQLQNKRKQFQREKDIAIAETTMQMITGAVTAYAQAQSLGLIAGPIVGAIEAGAMLAFGGAKIAMLAKLQPPSYGDGGELYGPKHKDKTGGLWVINPYTGQIEAKTEGGEYIVNADSYAANKNLVQAINSSKGKSLAFSLPAYASLPTVNTTRSVENIGMVAGGSIGNYTNTSNDLSILDLAHVLTQEMKTQTKTLVENSNSSISIESFDRVNKLKNWKENR